MRYSAKRVEGFQDAVIPNYQWEVMQGKRWIATAASGVLAKRIANALNIYIPKSRRAKARRS